jgi:hypothetical protein
LADPLSTSVAIPPVVPSTAEKKQAAAVQAPLIVQLLKRSGSFIADGTVSPADTWPEMLTATGRFFRYHSSTGLASSAGSIGFYIEEYDGVAVPVTLKNPDPKEK